MDFIKLTVTTFLCRHANSQVLVGEWPSFGELLEAVVLEALGARVQLLLVLLAVEVDVGCLGAFGLRALLAVLGAAQDPLTHGCLAGLALGVFDPLGAGLASKHGNDARPHPDSAQQVTFEFIALFDIFYIFIFFCMPSFDT